MTVAGVEIHALDTVPGHSAGMLRGVRHLQLHELPAGVPAHAVPPPGGCHCLQPPDQTPLSLLSPLPLEHGNVRTTYCVYGYT